ncbi:hypothetical protein PanWU01x14_114140 [Parasponia andersonii]|uniref:Retrotransposon gag domain-containing protein n=1 Tax=Parasponia andersonii TaxID=3476 RepID=A0A2P5CXC6_PARAD|nr:hypothetical protein PanWU01x14_114140 [Parasponia andersonii]
MTVDEYYAKFVELSQYAPIPGNHSRLQVVHFRTNLGPEICTRLEPFPITTLLEAYGTAQRIEATLIGDRGTTGGYKGKDTSRKMKKGRWQGEGSQSSGCSGNSFTDHQRTTGESSNFDAYP